MPRVLITDNLSAAGLRLLKEGGLEVDVRSGLKPLEVREALKEADGIIIRSGTTLTDVNRLVKQFGEMQKMMKQFTGGAGRRSAAAALLGRR